MQVTEGGAILHDPLAPYLAVDRTRSGGRPWLVAHMVGGLDGCATVGGRVGALSTGPDKALFVDMRAVADVVLVGAATIRAEGYGPVRLSAARVAAREASGRLGVPPVAIVTRSLDLDLSSPVFTDAAPGSSALVITCERADPRRLARVREVADVVVAGERSVEPLAVLMALGERGHRVVLCEGGPTLLGELVAADVVDELCLTVSPLMGGDPLPVSVTPPGSRTVPFALRHILQDSDTVFLRYERVRDE